MNTDAKIRRIRVAAIQVESKHGLIEANHEHAIPFIEKAAHEGAELVLLPELFSTGYIPNETIWDAAEHQILRRRFPQARPAGPADPVHPHRAVKQDPVSATLSIWIVKTPPTAGTFCF